MGVHTNHELNLSTFNGQEQQDRMKSPESTDWLAPPEQQFWFDRFSQGASNGFTDGLRFQDYQKFLKATIYRYFQRFPSPSIQTSVDKDERDTKENNTDTRVGLDDAVDRPDAGHECEFTRQQEMLVFKKFDEKNDHVIDRDEFAQMCQSFLHQVFEPTCALVVVDVQNDFIDGSLALINGPAGQDGADAVPIINDLIDVCQQYKATIVYTQDWHPKDHVSFHENLYLRKHALKRSSSGFIEDLEKSPTSGDILGHPVEVNGAQSTPSQAREQNERDFKYRRFVPDANLFDTVLFDDGRVEQKLWPIHCISNTWGAQLYPKLRIAPDSIKILKGTLSHVDAYSAFWDNMRLNETGLRQELQAKKVTDLFFCGLALDYCVAASALDAAKAGFITFVVEDACRGIDLVEIERRKQELTDHGAFIIQSNTVESYLKRQSGDHLDLDDGHGSGQSSKQCLSRDLIKTITYRRAFC